MDAAMTEYYIPTGHSETEFTEKRSRFLGQVWRVETEEEARARIDETKKRFHDARHNCWCYLLRDPAVERYSDDGEPQGTAGQPMLEVFRRVGITNVCCVATRYFGGVLLGTGGLTRAYSRSAKEALHAAGISVVRRWVEVELTCPYRLYERVKLEVEEADGLPVETDYAADVTLHALFPEGKVKNFTDRIAEVTAGESAPVVIGETLRDIPLQECFNG